MAGMGARHIKPFLFLFFGFGAFFVFYCCCSFSLVFFSAANPYKLREYSVETKAGQPEVLLPPLTDICSCIETHFRHILSHLFICC